MIGQQIINILNKDEEAMELLTTFNEACERQGLTPTEVEEARTTFITIMIARSPEAMEVMARDAYEGFRA
ncbi:hypothetical protein J2T13_000167 [Paenibacillus sp. DS2015]|uniref:hypothetical protein n=1 Tax=Paenibacillus sp. DS2015 TaxID=3373917 RepID=UPI003D1E9EB7